MTFKVYSKAGTYYYRDPTTPISLIFDYSIDYFTNPSKIVVNFEIAPANQLNFHDGQTVTTQRTYMVEKDSGQIEEELDLDKAPGYKVGTKVTITMEAFVDKGNTNEDKDKDSINVKLQ